MRSNTLVSALLVTVVLFGAPLVVTGRAPAQDSSHAGASQTGTLAAPSTTLDDTIESGETEVDEPARSRVPTGTVGRSVEVPDDKRGFVASDGLNPQKARILLPLALLHKRAPVEMQKLFIESKVARKERKTTATACTLLAVPLCLPLSLRGQAVDPAASAPPPQTPAPQTPAPGSQPPTLDDTIEAGDDEAGKPARDLVTWNEFDLKFTTFRFGAGFLYDFAAFSQDAASKEQIEVHPGWKIRDDRLLFRGLFKTERNISWSVGLLYDVPTKKFLFRQTQVMIATPELWGDIAIGRTKEGVSLNKVMIGYAGWTNERATFSDAMLPILADGVKWLGWIPEKHLIWNLGAYTDWVSEGQTFSTYEHQVAGRLAWVPLMSEATEKVLHIGFNLRYGKPKDDMLQLRSRPEVFDSPFFVDTGRFPATRTRISGIEAYYRPRSLLVGTEYFFANVKSPETGDPFFHGGDAFISWLPTGEVRVYNTRGAYFDQISPLRPVFSGGPGAWEFAGRFSYIDLDSDSLKGGKFWRITPVVNWHVSDNVRFEFVYGYGSLNRFDLVGKTQFFQSRVQLQF